MASSGGDAIFVEARYDMGYLRPAVADDLAAPA